jgi:hypothetical protein
MLPSPILPLAVHVSFGQNCCDASIGFVVVCICHSMPMGACFFKPSLLFHRLVESYHALLSATVYALIAHFSVYRFVSNAQNHICHDRTGINRAVGERGYQCHDLRELHEVALYTIVWFDGKLALILAKRGNVDIESLLVPDTHELGFSNS